MEKETVPTRVVSGNREHETMQPSAHSATRASQHEWMTSRRASKSARRSTSTSSQAVKRTVQGTPSALYTCPKTLPHISKQNAHSPSKCSRPKRALRMLPQKASRKESKSGPWHFCARISLPSIFTRSRGDGIGHMQGVSGANVMGHHDPKRYSL